MEREGEMLFTTPEGKKIYSTERQMTEEERKRKLAEQQDRDHAYSLWLQGLGPHPDEKRKKDNVVEFPGKKTKTPDDQEIAA